MTPTNPPNLRLRFGLLAAILALILGVGVVASLRPLPSPPEILVATGPKPELVAQGITTLPVYLFFGAVILAIVLVAVAWQGQP